MNLKTLLVLVVTVVVIGGVYYLIQKSPSPGEQTPTSSVSNSETSFKFDNPKKSAHYESSTPAHGSILAGVPINIVIDFNFDLATPSSISISKDGKEYGVGNTTIDSNKLTMRRNLDPDALDGAYKVSYNACWPDGSCHDGYFQFTIDRSISSTYEDLTSQKEITIRMSDLSFKPRDIKISAGTKIVWINDEDIEHYINTDSHPAHTYYLGQNSHSLKNGESYSATFSAIGIYPYHCSAHADVMTGNILVQ